MENKNILKKLSKIINKEFGPPFLEEGAVKSKVFKNSGSYSMSLCIGRRDIQIDEDFNVCGSGTLLVLSVKPEKPVMKFKTHKNIKKTIMENDK